MSDGNISPEGAVPPQEFDRPRFSKAVRLGDSFFDYGLNETQKAEVVQKLDENNDILLEGIGQDMHRKSALKMLSNLFGPNDNIPALEGYGHRFIELNIAQLEDIVISAGNYSQKKETLSFVLRLAESENQAHKQLLTGSLERILKQETSSIPSKDETPGRESSYKTYLESFRKIFQLGTDDQIIETTKYLAKTFDAASTPEQKRHAGNLVANTIWSNKESDPHDLRTQASRELVAHVIRDYGLDYSQFSKIWGNYSLETGLIGMARYNLDAILDLEAARPGMTKTLHDEFNISLFHRYPPEILIKQYDLRNDIEVPYGIMVNSIADHNEALASLGMEGLMKSIHYELNELGYAIRMYEGGSEEEVEEYFERSNQRYGIKTPEFGLISGHGTPDSIQMNWESPKQPSRIIRQQSFQGEPSLRFTDYMKKDTTLVLISCSTGVEGGIAQEISKQGLTVIGPDQEAKIGSISIDKNSSSSLDIRAYYGGAKSNRYKDGKLLAA